MSSERTSKLFISQTEEDASLASFVKEQGYPVEVWVRWGGGLLDLRPPMLQVDEPLTHIIGDTAIRDFVSPVLEIPVLNVLQEI